MPFFKRTTTLFDQQLDALADKVVVAAEHLVTLIEEPERAEALARLIGEAEHAADRILRDTFALQGAHDPSADRADLRALMEKVDDIVDVADAAAQRLWLHQCGAPTEEARALAALFLEGARQVKALVGQLKGLRAAHEILDACVEINALESRGDEVYRAAMRSLFSGEHDALHVARWKDVYERLERGLNRCEDVSRMVEGLVQAIA